MSINKSNVRSLAAAIVAALILPSCINLDENQGEGVGYLELPGLTADVEVYELVPTKSGTTTLSALVGVTGYNLPDIEAITFNLTDQESYSKTWTGALNGTLELPVGTYTLSGKYDNAEYDGLGEALYGDFTTTVTISSQGTVTPEIKLPLINSLVAVSMAKDFDKHFTPDKGDCVTFTSRNASVSAAVGKYVFVPASSKLTVSVKGTNSAGVETLTYDDELTSPAAKTACSIVCGMSTTDVPSVTLASDLSAVAFEDVLYFPAATVENISDANAAKLTYEIMGGDYSDWTTVTVKDTTANGETYKYITGLTSGTTYSLRASVGNIFSNGNPEGVSFTQVDFDDCVSVVASAVHTKDDNGDLDGTKVTASVDITRLPSIIKKLATVTATTGTFTNSAGTTRSTAAATALSKVSTTSLEMKNPDGWPYIPHGDNHTMTVNVTCKIGEKTYTTTSSKGGITVPEPEFSVNVSGKTSYNYYTSQGAAVANTKNAETIYEVSSNITIADNILGNSNYSKPTVTYEVDGKTSTVTYSASKTHYQGEISGLSWNSHTLKATVTFDGKESVGECPCVITGLPYKKGFITDDDLTGWSTIGASATHYKNKGYLMWYRYFGTITETNYFSKPFYAPVDKHIGIKYSAVFYAANTGSTHGEGVFSAGVTSSSTIEKNVNTKTITTSNVSGALDSGSACSNPVNLSGTSTIQNGDMICYSTSNQKGGHTGLGVYAVQVGLFLASTEILYN